MLNPLLMTRYFFRSFVVLILFSCGKVQDKIPSAVQQDTLAAMDTMQPQNSQPVHIQAEPLHEQARNIYESFFTPGSTFYVVSIEGTPLYQSAHETSKTLTTFFYGDSVEVVEHPLSLAELDLLRDGRDTTFLVRAKAGDHEGFIKSSELTESIIPKEDGKAHLFFQGASCMMSYSFNRAFTYYGIYKENGGYVRKKITPKFSVKHFPWEELAWEIYDIQAPALPGKPEFMFSLPKLLADGAVINKKILPAGEFDGTLTLDNTRTMHMNRLR